MVAKTIVDSLDCAGLFRIDTESGKVAICCHFTGFLFCILQHMRDA